MSIVSEADASLLATAELIKILEGILSLPTEFKVEHEKLIKEFTDILKNGLP